MDRDSSVSAQWNINISFFFWVNPCAYGICLDSKALVTKLLEIDWKKRIPHTHTQQGAQRPKFSASLGRDKHSSMGGLCLMLSCRNSSSTCFGWAMQVEKLKETEVQYTFFVFRGAKELGSQCISLLNKEQRSLRIPRNHWVALSW